MRRFGSRQALLFAACTWACSAEERAPFAEFEPPEPEAPDAGVIVGNPPDAGSDCGGQVIPAITELPTLYFVIDRSGSMSEPIDASGATKYDAAKLAVASLLLQLGHRLRYGAMAFPWVGQEDGCAPGVELFSITQGDPARYAAQGDVGPVLSDLLRRLDSLRTLGGTPTSATLQALSSTLNRNADSGGTYVLLATDGAPNCNEDNECDRNSCIPDLESVEVDGLVCGRDLSCCDPKQLGSFAGANCIDDTASVEAVRALAEVGIPTYVVGMPGSEVYGALLAELAVAGNTARAEAPAYFAVSDTEALSEALFEIGTGVAISCDVALESPPSDPNLVNVYFDGEIVPRDEEQGWAWSDAGKIMLQGEACSILKSGAVLEVEIVYGCETVVR